MIIRDKLPIIVLIDLLAFPRMPGLAIPFTLVPVLLLTAKEKHKKKELALILSLLLIVLASVANGALQQSHGLTLDNLKRGLQLISMFGYFLYFKRSEINLEHVVNLLRAFFIWVFLLLMIFLFTPNEYGFIVSNIYRETEEFMPSNISNLRFPYIFSDPNSAGYLIAMCLALYIKIERNIKWLSFVSLLGFVCVYAAQSRGALVGLVVITLALILDIVRMRRFRVLEGAALILMVVVGAVVIWQEFGATLFEITDKLSGRFDLEKDFGGGREDKYKYMLENLNFLPIGTGYELSINGFEFRPHSDLIRWNFAYGLLSLPLLIALMIPKRANLTIFAVALVPFFVNSLIDDYRLFAIYLILYPLGHLFNKKYAKEKKDDL